MILITSGQGTERNHSISRDRKKIPMSLDDLGRILWGHFVSA
jgi:hypothetical protein